ncbi:MAG: hypothetical protein ACE3L7_07355 [Candidatus Pristimantibacillus sp.]
MNWRHANREQLINIACIDNGAALEHRIAAAEELKRRNRKKHVRVQYKMKEVYAR